MGIASGLLAMVCKGVALRYRDTKSFEAEATIDSATSWHSPSDTAISRALRRRKATVNAMMQEALRYRDTKSYAAATLTEKNIQPSIPSILRRQAA